MNYAREHKAEGILFTGNSKVYGLCEKIDGQYRLVKGSGVNHQDVLSFATKNEAKRFCKENAVPYYTIIRYGSRFENIWAISMGNQLTDVWVHTKGNF